MWFGRSSQIVTFRAAALPVFFQVIVKRTFEPAFAIGDEARLVSEMLVFGTLAGVTGGVWRQVVTVAVASFE